LVGTEPSGLMLVMAKSCTGQVGPEGAQPSPMCPSTVIPFQKLPLLAMTISAESSPSTSAMTGYSQRVAEVWLVFSYRTAPVLPSKMRSRCSSV
jgi:hypothetical protein